ncbi:laccase-3-like isoform X1 [Pyrus communis]|uniref:laccase-3-like isoform X1 n=1 Tax=Pyrus communis TaxID=23211 RepID=UPI0035BEF621
MEASKLTLLLGLLAFLTSLASFSAAEFHFHEFIVEARPVRRLCRTHSTITVNGQFPGPTLEVRNGDSVAVTVTNRARYNVTIHWHGLRQLNNPWADGPEYVTQCPIQPGATYTYRFTIIDQEGTLWWHAHSRWLRATVYGALIIYPRLGVPYPFPMPKREVPILLGEWFDRDPQDVMRLAAFTGGAPNVSDAYTINGQPGDLYRCSRKETIRIPVVSGESLLLRIINSALNQELFFTVANHQLTVVGADASYTKPFATRVIMLGPGQTTDALLTADQRPARYYMAARAYQTAQNAPFDNTTTTAILEYKNAASSNQGLAPVFPALPAYNDTATATAYTAQIRSPSRVRVPTQIDEYLFFTVGLGLYNCTVPNSPRCQGPNNTRFAASMNNVSFVLPRTNSLMQAAYYGVPGVFTTDFPPIPPVQFNYTGNVPRGLWSPRRGTKLYRLKYGANVQIVLQDTNIVTIEEHPMHLHGYHFYVIGSGFGNYNPSTDPARFNLFDPPQRNTIGTPPGGWVAIRFKADNPGNMLISYPKLSSNLYLFTILISFYFLTKLGVWLMHCHLDSHLFLGLAMAFLVENGIEPLQSVIPPPPDLPRC